MRKFADPQTRVPGAKHRIDPITLMTQTDKLDRPLWDMPSPIRYAKHAKRRKDKKTGEVVTEPVMVPIYRGTSASYARYVKAQIKRAQRKASERRRAALKAEAEKHTEKAIEDLVMNPGGHNVGK